VQLCWETGSFGFRGVARTESGSASIPPWKQESQQECKQTSNICQSSSTSNVECQFVDEIGDGKIRYIQGKSVGDSQN
jgi:hypothetical protein